MDAIFAYLVAHFAEITVGDWLQAASILIAVGVFLVQNQRSVEAQQIEIYQRLEIESNAVFKLEAEYKDSLAPFKEALAPEGVFNGPSAEVAARQLVARKYYENLCNLFEVSARLRRRRIVPAEVFASWVAWYFDTLCEWGFRAVWHDMRDNYTGDLRKLFDPFVAQLIEEWDRPHADGAFADTAPDIPDDKREALRRSFYAEIGREYKCPVILKWLDECERTRPSGAHPLAYT